MIQKNSQNLSRTKFTDPDRTADGQPRARVSLKALDTLWFNTGTLCNIECVNCYIESSPRNDRLAYISRDEVDAYLDEIDDAALGTRQIGITGGEPFMNPEIVEILESCLRRGHETIVLTNAMRPMTRRGVPLTALQDQFGSRLLMRVSIDHYTATLHEQERGLRTWAPMIEGITWLARNGFRLSVAGRTCWGESEQDLRRGYADLFAELGIDLDAGDPGVLILFPEMDETADVPEITTGCWDVLGLAPDSVMCASSRMVVKRKGAERPTVVACTLIPYDDRFEMGHSLSEAGGDVKLNHPHCSKFCVLGGGSCTR